MEAAGEPGSARGRAALITGAGAGIGRAAALAYARRGGAVTLVELPRFSAKSEETAALCRAIGCPRALCVSADVTDPAALEAAFDAHKAAHGRLDVAILNAGIGEEEDFTRAAGGAAPAGGPEASWRTVLAVNLTAVADGVRLAVQAMRAQRAAAGAGATYDIVCVASAGGIFPMPMAPIYAASKAGVVQLVRSLAPLRRAAGIRVSAFCPQFVDTSLVSRGVAADARMARVVKHSASRVMSPTEAAEALMTLVGNDAAAGRALFLNADTGAELWPPAPGQRMRYALFREMHGEGPPSGGPTGAEVASAGRDNAGAAASAPGRAPSPARRAALAAWATAELGAAPLATFAELQVCRLTSDFRAATQLRRVPLPALPLPAGVVLVRRVYAGVNASDVNATSGKYFGGAAANLPFPAGFESVGVVAAAAADVVAGGPAGGPVGGPAGGRALLAVGSPVAALTGGYSEYGLHRAKDLIPIDEPSPQILSLVVSGLTASIGLEVAGNMRPAGAGSARQIVLVTAAAGGTGQFAVQLAKLSGHYVIATCGGPAKAALLRSLGADRVIDHTSESVGEVLRTEFPRGLDIIYESVGGAMLETASKALANRGRLIIIGMVAQYGTDGSGWAPAPIAGLAERLLFKSATMAGFFLPAYASLHGAHMARLTCLIQSGQLRVQLDAREFAGVEAAADAVDHLHSGRSAGKVVVRVAKQLPPEGPAEGSSSAPRARM